MTGAIALAYALYRLTNRNDEITTPQVKVDESPLPLEQPGRHHENESVIEDGFASINDQERDVYVASRIIMGGREDAAVGRFDKYILGAVKAYLTDGLTVAMDDAPDPTHHWCVVVGDYLHQLQGTGFPEGWNYYTNERYGGDHDGWTAYKLGVTNFNDVAIRNAASHAINEMPEAYNVIDNNCQHFSLRLLDKILRDGRKMLKKINQTYGEMVEEPVIIPKKVVAYKIGDEPPAEEETENVPAPQKTVKPVEITEPKPEVIEGSVAVDDINGSVAIVEDEEQHQQKMQDAVAIMIQNTPSIKETVQK